MTISVNDNSLKNELNRAQPGSLPSMFAAMKLGDVVRALPTTLRKAVPTVSAPYQLTTLDTIVLPDDAKANTILRAYARAGSGTKGELTVVAYGATPTAGQIAVAPNGDIVTVHSGDVWTSLDVVYLPEKYDVVELTLPVVPGTGVCALPTWITDRVS
jgi:hypothetical protein